MVDLGSIFSVAVGPQSGALPVQPVRSFGSFQARFHLYDGDSLSFTIPGASAAARIMSGLETDAWLYRDNALWQRFRVLPMAQTWGESGEDEVSVSAVCYKQLLNGRLLHSPAPTYTNLDEGVIIAGLITHTQALPGGQLNIFGGTYTTGTLRSRTEYKAGDNIGALINDLTKVINGPVWRIQPGSNDRQLSVVKPSSFPVAAMPAIHGGNVRRLTLTPSGSFANSAFVDSTEATVPVFYDHPTIATDPRGRWEVGRSPSTSVVTQSVLQELAEGTVAELITPPSAWSMAMKTSRWLTDSGYMPGQFVNVKVPGTIVDPLDPPSPEVGEFVVIQVVEVTVDVSADAGIEVTVAGGEV